MRLQALYHRVKNVVRILRGHEATPRVDRDLVWYTEPKLRVVSSSVPEVPPGTRLERLEDCWAVLGRSGEILTSGRELEQVAREAWEIYHEFDHCA